MNPSRDPRAFHPTKPPARLGTLRLGCPVWAVAAWVGNFFTSRDRNTWLGEYSSVFGTVEGNSTFYALPDPETVQRWSRQAQHGFRFAFKVPGAITHEAKLEGCETVTRLWLKTLRILHDADVLGPTLLQLPPDFDASRDRQLRSWLDRWPDDFPLAVEVRHADWFDQGPHEALLDAELTERGMDRVLFDSRCLYSEPPDDETERISQSRKPRSPFRATVTAHRPFVRFIGRDRIEKTDPWLASWSLQVAQWLMRGLDVYFFTHAPDDAFAPALARRFYQRLRQELPQLPEMPAWPAERLPKQLDLF